MSLEMEPVASWCFMLDKVVSNGLGGLLGYLTVLLNSIAAGHAKAPQEEQVGMLAGYGLSQSIANVFQVGPAVGLTNAFDTFISQANGAGETRQCTLILGRCRAILTLHWFLIVPIALFSEPLLTAIGIDAVSAHYAAVFNQINIVGWWFRNQMYASRKFLSNLNRPRANLIITSVAVIVHFLILLAYRFQLRLEHLAWVTVATTALHSTLLFGYILFRASDLKMKKRWVVKNSFVFEGWRNFLQFGIPGIVHFCAELWALEVFTIIAGSLGAVSLAACTVNYNFTTLGYLIAVGVGSATAGLVGEAIGKGHAHAARKLVVRFALLSFVVWLPMAVVFFGGAWRLSAVFTPQPDVQAALAPLMQLYAFAFLVDCLNLVTAAALRSLGHTRLPALTSLAFYYVFMLPLAYLLAFPFGLEVFGMYSAYIAAGVGILLVLVLRILCIPFETAVHECAERFGSFGVSDEPSSQSLQPISS